MTTVHTNEHAHIQQLSHPDMYNSSDYGRTNIATICSIQQYCQHTPYRGPYTVFNNLLLTTNRERIWWSESPHTQDTIRESIDFPNQC